MQTIKHYKTGDIVYWIGIGSDCRKYVEWGVVCDEFTDGVWVDIYCVKDYQTVDGVPVTEMTFPTEWKKLPKNWRYDTKLFTIGNSLSDNEMLRNVNKADKELLRKIIQRGYLVPAHTTMHFNNGYPVEQVENGRYRIVYEISRWIHKSTGGSFKWHELYETYEEAQAEIDRLYAESQRIANMSDEEYQAWDLQDRLDKWRTPNMTDEYIQSIKDWLMSLSDFHDLEFRGSCSGFQYRKVGNKKWLTVGISMN